MHAFFTRFVVAHSAEAAELAASLEGLGAAVEREEHILSVLWPETDADEAEEWEERAFVELIFWLRAWAGDDPRRQITILDEQPIDVDETLIRRRAS